ncbi:hypothetical protein [Burkholderia ambifaria]
MSNLRSTSSLTIRVAARGHRHVCADQTEQQDGTFACLASTFSSDALFFTQIRFNAPERGSTTRVASALRCAASAAPDSSLPRRAQRIAIASRRMKPEQRTRGKRKPKPTDKPDPTKAHHRIRKRFLFFVHDRNEAPPSNSM